MGIVMLFVLNIFLIDILIIHKNANTDIHIVGSMHKWVKIFGMKMFKIEPF